ncbi:MAG: hypothetical protein ACRDGQ_10175 [Candidatus Limnocylindrales bacterium]
MTAIIFPERLRWPFVLTAALLGSLLALDAATTTTAIRLWGIGVELNPIETLIIGQLGVVAGLWGVHMLVAAVVIRLGARRIGLLWLVIPILALVVGLNAYQLATLA